MNRQQLAFLATGLAFGILVAYGLFHAVDRGPNPNVTPAGAAGVPAPAGPMAATQTGPAGGGGPAGGAPMMQEINSLKRMLQEQPEHLPALVRLANLYHDAGLWQQAVGYYDRALALEPNDPDLLTDQGICYRGLGEFDKALERFDRAQALDAKHWQSLFNKAVVVGFDQGRIDAALEAVGRMESITPRPSDLPVDRVAQLRDALERSRAAAPAERGAS